MTITERSAELAHDLLHHNMRVTVESVESHDSGHIMHFKDGWLFNCPTNDTATPKPGDIVYLIASGLGGPVRGLYINGAKIFHRTQSEEAERHKQWLSDLHKRKKAEFEAQRDKLDADYDSLPAEFKQRIDGFRERNPDFRWEHEAYEMSVCVDAVKIAHFAVTVHGVRSFREYPPETQKLHIPDLFDGHSANSFAAAVYLAELYLESPSDIPKAHGALCPLSGCVDYGCWAASTEARGA